MRILWVGNAPWAGSGYGEQTAMFVPRLQAMGHQMAIQCNYGLQGTRQEWNGCTVYPADGFWGNKAMGTYAKDHQADLIIVLHDAWVLAPQEWEDGPPVAVWAPIDHYPIPPAVLAPLSHERVHPIAMSRFGEQMMAACELNPSYVPHGVDRSVFYPRHDIRDEVRSELGIPKDAFLVGMVAANKGNPATIRKGFDKAFLAFSRLAKDHDDAWMYVHSEAEGTPGNGISLVNCARSAGCPEDRLRFPGPSAWHLGMQRDVVAALYQAFDVLLMPSMGEGFGIPLLEAQACGLPVITSDHSAMTELAAAGWLVDGDPVWDDLQTSWFYSPFVESIYRSLSDAYNRRDQLEAMGEKAAVFAAGYDADLVASEYWAPTLEKIMPDAKPVSRQVRRAQERKRAKVAA